MPGEMEMDGRIIKRSIRGAAGFGLGSVFAFIGISWPPLPPFGGFTGIMTGFALCAIFGTIISAGGMRSDRIRISETLAFVFGFMIPAIVIPIVMIGELAEGVFGTIGIPVVFGICFGMAGFLGNSFSYSRQYTGWLRSGIRGGFSFFMGGLLGGIVTTKVPHVSIPGMRQFAMPVGTSFLIAGLTGGALTALFSALAEIHHENSSHRKFLSKKSSMRFHVALGAGYLIMIALMIYIPEQVRFFMVKNTWSRGEQTNDRGHDSGARRSSLLHTAAMEGDVKSAEFLINQGVDVNLRRWDEWTPLHLAALNTQTGMAEWLLSKGADPNAMTNNGETPLHHALKFQSQQDMIRVLLEAGSDPWRQDANGTTPWEMARKKGLGHLFPALEDLKADPPSGDALSTAPFTETRGKILFEEFKSLPAGERPARLAEMRGKRFSIPLLISTAEPDPIHPGSLTVRSVTSNGLSMVMPGVLQELPDSWEKGRIYRVRGVVNTAFFSQHLTLIFFPGAIIEKEIIP